MTIAKTTVLNLRNLPKRIENGLYIGRGSDWGNPFVIGKDGDRETVLLKYKHLLWRSTAMMKRLHELRGRKLLCFCAPERCHGDVLVAALAWQDAKQRDEAAELKSTAAGRRLHEQGYTTENLKA